jgi:hypothetical protein
MGAGTPYDLRQIKDTLYYYFTDKAQLKAMGELDAPTTTFQEVIDEERGFAMVVITKKAIKVGDTYRTEIRVGLQRIDGFWRVQVFPEFYPLNVSKITTGE